MPRYKIPMLIECDAPNASEAEDIARTIMDGGIRSLEDADFPQPDVEAYVMDAQEVTP